MGILALMVHEVINNKPYIINDILGVALPFNWIIHMSIYRNLK